MRSSLFALSLLATLTLSASPAFASPWTLPADELVVGFDYTFQRATREFLIDGRPIQAYPLNGRYVGNNLRTHARYGFTDRFELGADVDFRQVAYLADALLLNDPEPGDTAGELTDQIRNFNTSAFGVADVYLHARYNLVRGAVFITSESSAKLPTGYDEPTGTFVTDDAGNTRIGGQATLGDAQSDLTQSLLLGTYIAPINTFVRLDAGLRYRFGAPGNQALGGVRAGTFINDNIVLLAGLRGVHTITEGEVIGQTYVTGSPQTPANQLTPDDIEVLDLRLDRSALTADAGLIIRVAGFELLANYGYTFWGRNTAASHSFSLGTIFALPDATAAR